MPTITSGSEVLPVTASGWTVPSARTRTLSSLLIDVSLRTSDGEMVVLVEVVLVGASVVVVDVDVVVVAGGSAFLSSPPQLVAMSRATAQQAVDRSVRLRGDRDMRPARLVR